MLILERIVENFHHLIRPYPQSEGTNSSHCENALFAHDSLDDMTDARKIKQVYQH
jgi:hypothetical protein